MDAPKRKRREDPVRYTWTVTAGVVPGEPELALTRWVMHDEEAGGRAMEAVKQSGASDSAEDEHGSPDDDRFQ